MVIIRDPQGIRIGKFKTQAEGFKELRGVLDAWIESLVKGRFMVMEKNGAVIATARIEGKLRRVHAGRNRKA